MLHPRSSYRLDATGVQVDLSCVAAEGMKHTETLVMNIKCILNYHTGVYGAHMQHCAQEMGHVC